VKLDAYTVVFLRRPADTPGLTDEELDKLQEEHVAFNARMRREGHALVTGPLRGQPDETLRGINIFRTSVEETRRLMDQDPSVRAGRLAVDVFTWLVPAGLLGDHPASQIVEE
jgi:hypothetical protein